MHRLFRRIFTLFTLLGMVWGLISYLLAGNWSYTFSSEMTFLGSDTAFKIFLIYTICIISIPLLTFTVFLIHHFLFKKTLKR
jgi:uncharacterized BrkB/YihY/UPF0761 family membrane protein